MKREIKEVLGLIGDAKVIGIMTHHNGDGDAFGSLLGLRNILEKSGKRAVVFSNESLPDYLRYLRKEAHYRPTKRYRKIDLLIGLDLPDPKRFTLPQIFERAKSVGAKTLVIDHHTDGDLHKLVDVVWQKTDISSTSEMIFWLAEELGVDIDKTTAQFLLWGLETDTYFLENKNVFKTTHKAQKALWGRGANTEEIKENTKATSPTQNKDFMYRVLSRVQNNDGILFSYVTWGDKRKFRIKGAVSSAVVSYLEYQHKPKVAVVAEQRDKKHFKVSMRSNHSDVNVSEICKQYGGGGHVKASGFESEGRVEDFVNGDGLKIILDLIKKS